MSNVTESDCKKNCREVYEKCLQEASGNPTAQARCEKFNKRCKEQCKEG